MKKVVQRAYNRFMSGPTTVVSSQSFQENIVRVFRCFFLANLPCSASKFHSLVTMQGRVTEFLIQVARDEPWLDHILLQISSFSQDCYESLKLGRIEAPLQAIKAEILGLCEPDQLHEILACFFMASTGQVEYAGGNMCLTMMKRCEPIERDCLYSLMRWISRDLADSRDLLAIYEHLYT